MKLLLLLLSLSLGLAPAARSQSFCASDGQPRPVALLERFISADCERCWSDSHSALPAGRELAIDWILPSGLGADAPLSAAASRDAQSRLDALGHALVQDSFNTRHPVQGKPAPLRVAHGVAVNDYIAASIEMKPAAPGRWTAWLLLVETIPAGTEGTPVARNLARNLLVSSWEASLPPAKSRPARFFEARPMLIPEGAKPERLRVVGWVEDTRGRIRSMAQSQCTPSARP